MEKTESAVRSIAAPLDPVHDVLHYGREALQAIFAPKSVAVVGATEKEGSVGRTILWNLISSPFGGTVYPINPNRAGILGIKAYPSIRNVPDPVDLAVIVTPATTVPGIIRECVQHGVRGAIVISAGFKEIGEEGQQLEQQVLQEAKRGRMRIIGPNCLGVMNTHSGLNATFATAMARPGNVGFLSQSGALCTAVLDWSFKENVGFSAFVSIGSMLDVNWGDLIYYLGDDPLTQSIVIYMETIGDARSFLSAAREVSLVKPIIVIKPGRTAGAAKAAASHTGSMTGSDEVLETAFRRSGVLRVDEISDLFHMAELLAKQPRPRGRKLTILTNAGGPGVLATDALLTGGGELSNISPEAFQRYGEILPAAWSRNNPIDILGDASPERYARAVEIAAKDPNSDGMLVILTPQAMTDPTAIAEHLEPYAQSTGKPLLASWMGGDEVAPGEAILNRANIPTLAYPDTAARMFNYMWRYAENLRLLYETPSAPIDSGSKGVDRGRAKEILAAVLASGRTILTEYESKELLAAYGIPTVTTRIARSEDEAARTAAEIGYPAVLKLYSETITHKTDVGGVKLSLSDEAAVRRAFGEIRDSVTAKAGAEHFQGVTVQPMVKLDGYELILGSSPDPQFGPVLLFGMGGQLVEVFKDRALGLPPLTTTLARRMMERTSIFKALKGVRGRRPVYLGGLEQLMVRFSELVAEQPRIAEIDINPLLASPERLLALDARVVLHPAEKKESELPRLAIRPYPSQYEKEWTTKNGRRVVIRPIRPDDETLLVDFHEVLSEKSVRLRYMNPLLLSHRVAHERLSRICFLDYDREMALVVEDRDSDGRKILAVGRLSKLRGAEEGRFSILVGDPYQGWGLGKEIVRRLVDFARDEGLERLTTSLSSDNQGMLAIIGQLGFRKTGASEDGKMIHVELSL
ncbi:MAG: bifunctional acetate--CoA ligase family protein/GNAT family N-acetyltransferase [Candidatus Eisenbacteria bacterium]